MMDRHLTETEAEDYANEQAESAFAQETMGVHDDEMDDLSIVDHFNLVDDDFGPDQWPNDMEFPGLDLCNDDYNSLDNN